MVTANSLQKKNVTSPLPKFHQTKQIQMHTQVPTPTLLLWLGHRMLGLKLLTVPSHTPQQEGLSFILEQTCGYVVS